LKTSFFHKNYKPIITALAVLFFIISFFVYYQENFEHYRLLRGVFCFIFLGLLFFYNKKNTNNNIFAFLACYGLSSVLTIWYENNILATLSMVLNFLSFLFLIRALLPKINFKKMNVFFSIIFIVMLAINGYLGYLLMDELQDMTLSNSHFIFLVLTSMAVIFSTFLALLYNHVYNTKGSLVFALFVFLLFFADVFRAVAYYDIVSGDFTVHISRTLLIVALCQLIHYTFIKKEKDELLYPHIF